jgi:hypothetical protein
MFCLQLGHGKMSAPTSLLFFLMATLVLLCLQLELSNPPEISSSYSLDCDFSFGLLVVLRLKQIRLV